MDPNKLNELKNIIDFLFTKNKVDTLQYEKLILILLTRTEYNRFSKSELENMFKNLLQMTQNWVKLSDHKSGLLVKLL
jgi:hypothetical protein